MNSSRAKTLYQLIWQTRRLFQRLRATSDELLDATGINSSQRAVLEFLHGQPPQTVPAIARERTVSRQHIQTVVNDLLELGLVEAIDNPSHKRSPLIRITAAGEALFASIRANEQALLKEMAKRFSSQDLRVALATLESLDGYLASDDWKTHR
jgi:DNA-binding MarR family transcriptional regulator